VGGIGTILVVLAVVKKWPEMRDLKTLDVPVMPAVQPLAPSLDTGTK
jgi:hypothetical protein